MGLIEDKVNKKKWDRPSIQCLNLSYTDGFTQAGNNPDDGTIYS